MKKLILATALAFTLVGASRHWLRTQPTKTLSCFEKTYGLSGSKLWRRTWSSAIKRLSSSGRCSNSIPRSLSRNRTRNTHCLKSMRKTTRQ